MGACHPPRLSTFSPATFPFHQYGAMEYWLSSDKQANVGSVVVLSSYRGIRRRIAQGLRQTTDVIYTPVTPPRVILPAGGDLVMSETVLVGTTGGGAPGSS